MKQIYIQQTIHRNINGESIHATHAITLTIAQEDTHMAKINRNYI